MKAVYTKRLGNLVASRAAFAGLPTYHIIYSNAKWSVVLDGSLRALRNFLTLEEAQDYAEGIAEKRKGMLVLHEKNGQVKQFISFNAK